MSKKLTTEEFIKKAKSVHGDRYDYSKVDYVNSRTKVCIICSEHGEFWQEPSMHLRGHGCPKCSAERAANKNLNWTLERCYEEAQKYLSRGEFKEKCPYGYSSARKHKWLDNYTWFRPVRKQVPAGYWTYEKCFEEAKKYRSLKEFEKNANGARQYAAKMGWIKDYVWFEKPFRWTRELCEKEAQKFTTRKDFYTISKNAYAAAAKHGWLDSFTWLESIVRPNGYWTKERCEEEARNYSSKKEFLEGCPAAHAAAAKRGWLDDFVWLVDKRIDIIKDKIDSVYVYVFEETKFAYVGRTLIRRQKKRDREHIFNQENDNVARYAKKMNVPVPPMTILETNLTLEEGLDREDYWRNWYEKQGYTMLNRLATGIGKGSLGRISHGKWNRNTCYKEAQKYKSCSEFEKANGSAYDAARRNGWIKDYKWFEVLWEAKWDKSSCYQEAKKYKTRGEFMKSSPSAYNIAHRRKWIEDYGWLDSRIKYPKGYWNDYDRCYQEARRYVSRIDFQNGNKSAYVSARKHGWLDDYKWFKEKPRLNYWNKETCFEEAQKYRTRTEFQKGSVGAYQKALKNGWLAEYTWMKQYVRSWSYEACKLEASKYERRTQFKKAFPGGYKKALEQGWLDDFFPETK